MIGGVTDYGAHGFAAHERTDEVSLVGSRGTLRFSTFGDEPLRLYSIYAPSHHAAGIVQATADDAEADEESGKDVPPEWTVQPEGGAEDKHA